jgi:N-succinyldiaminopimelate aminotransferase
MRHVIPVNGTREALFAIAHTVVDRSGADKPVVIMPNPFYQIYEGACLMAGAEPYYLNCLPETGYRPDLDAVPETIWRRCQLIYVCSPNNPTGAVCDDDFYRRLLSLSDRYGFVIAADECYGEIYPDEDRPPLGLLQHAMHDGRDDFRNIVVFNSLSKRSNVPGMRSGFVAGDADIMQSFLLYRTYHGCAMAPPIQAASIAAWRDEAHVEENRRLYREKFAAVLAILCDVVDVAAPEGGFCLWPRLPVDDIEFTAVLIRDQKVIVLPGQFLARDSAGVNPGKRHVRVALVASLDQCIEAAERIRGKLQ